MSKKQKDEIKAEISATENNINQTESIATAPDKSKKNTFTVFWKKVWAAICFLPKIIGKGFNKFYKWFDYNFTAKMVITNTFIYMIMGGLTLFTFMSVLGNMPVNMNTIKLRILLFTLIPTTLVIELLTVLLTSKILLSPIKKITAKTRKISRENLGKVRLEEGGSRGELKELIQVLNAMLDNLQESFEAQERFVSDASHELKTPIAILHGYSDMLRRWGKTDQAILEEGIEAIFKETQHMSSLVNMLLFLSRTNRNAANLKIENFFLNDLLEEVIKETEKIESSHHIYTGKMMAITVDADRAMIKQLLRILIDNAIKYTPENGTIKLSCHRDETSAYIVVQDNGIGISQEDLPHIFERFYRADKARSRETGTGLGLSIAKKIADAHNSEIIISSEVGVGTIVNLKMPLPKGSIIEQGE